MIIKFNNPYLSKLYSNEVGKGKPVFSLEVVKKFKQKILLLSQLENTKILREFKSLHFESLKGEKKGLHSIRINKQYRLEFKNEKDRVSIIEIILIEELSKHYE